MELFGPSYTVETVDGGGELGFRLRSNPNLMNVLSACVGAGFIVYSVVSSTWFFAFGAIAILWYSLKPFFLPTDQWMWANRHGVVVYGGLIRWERMQRLHFDGGGEDEPSYLVIRTVAGTTSLFAGIDREQCRQIITAIYRRFPYAEMADDPGPPTMFGKWSELTTLGLSAKLPEDKER